MPYLAVIVDSFRAATKSKVLWVACVAIWVLLALLAPSGTRETLTTDFTSMDLQNATRLKAVLADGLVNPEKVDTAIGQISQSLPEDMQARLRRVGDGEDERIRYSELADGLTEMLDGDDWYSAGAWQDLRKTGEAELLEKRDAALNEDQQRRLRRLRIVAAIPGVFGARTPTSLRPTYAGIDFPFDLPLDRRRFVTIVNQLVLPTIISWLLGFVLVFLGIVVTAPIIPGMLQPGSLHLLLSKPISRTGLLLAKFVGGCAFVLLCVAQLVIGLYLILGLRLDVWNLRLLWCIPASVLLFSVFYAVSVASGLIFRSEVLSIGITCCFGGICLVTGVIGGVFDNFVTARDSITTITRVGGNYVAKTAGGPMNYFDPDENRWHELVANVKRDDLVFDPVIARTSQGIRMLTAVSRGGRFNSYGFGAVDLMVWVPPNENKDGDRRDSWDFTSGVRLPAATTQILIWRDQLVAVNSVGLSVLSLEKAINPDVAPEKTASAANASSTGGWLGKLSRMMGNDAGKFRSILPPGIIPTPPSEVVADDTGIWLGSGGRLTRLIPPGDAFPSDGLASDAHASDEQDAAAGLQDWSLAAETITDGDPSLRFKMMVSGDRLLHVRVGQDAALYDSQTLDLVATTEIPVDASLKSIAADEASGFVVVLSDGSAWRIDRTNQWTQLPIEDATAVQVDGTQRIFATEIDRVVSLAPGQQRSVNIIDPNVEVWRKVDRYLVSPLRFVIPQTGELGDVIAASISGRSEVLMGDPSSDQTQVTRYQWMRPLVSCGGFIVVMMTLNVLFFRSRDY